MKLFVQMDASRKMTKKLFLPDLELKPNQAGGRRKDLALAGGKNKKGGKIFPPYFL
jgi:hypothetical protein